MLKSFLLFFVFLVINNMTFSQNFWEKIESPTTRLLNSLSFIDSLNGWVSGDSGLIIHTSDGGKNWETQYTNDSLNVVNIFFLDENYGWASGFSPYYPPYGTYLLRTTDGGTNWNSELLRLGEVIVHSFYFLDSLTGFAVGGPQVFHRTTDGGSTWEPVLLDSAVVSGIPPVTIKFYNSMYGYAVGGVRDIVGVVWRTTDGGLSWSTVVSNLTTEPLYDVHIFDSLHIIVMGGDPEFGTTQVVSTDGGNTWEYISLGIFYYPVSVGFRTNTEGWVPMGEQCFFLYTSDSGENWSIVTTPDSAFVTRICFTDSSRGYGIGPYGTIVKYVYPDSTSSVEYESAITDFYLEQNYPNPFNPNTKIGYSIPVDGFVKLAVYNLLGEEVATLHNSQQKAGHYEVNFDARGLSSGIYIYKIETTNFTASRKLVLIK